LARAPQAPVAPAGVSPAYPPNGALAASSSTANLPPPPPPTRQNPQLAGIPPGAPSTLYEAPPIGLVRVTLKETSKPAAGAPTAAGGPVPTSEDAAKGKSVDTYLPVSLTRAVHRGGIDAPTGEQS